MFVHASIPEAKFDTICVHANITQAHTPDGTPSTPTEPFNADADSTPMEQPWNFDSPRDGPPIPKLNLSNPRSPRIGQTLTSPRSQPGMQSSSPRQAFKQICKTHIQLR